jgi:ribosomal protein RSM22 (predicted rRNA methylase)
MFLKDCVVPFEDEKYAYVVARRVGAPAGNRIIGPVRVAKPGATARICGQAGISETFALRRDKPAFDTLRRKDWGDAVAPPSATPEEIA